MRIELTHKGFADLSLTTWVPRLKSINYIEIPVLMSGGAVRCCSAAERHNYGTVKPEGPLSGTPESTF